MKMNDIRYRVMHAKPYDNVKWHEKVTRMPDVQVFAIDRVFAKRGLYEPQKGTVGPQYEQLSLFDIFPEVMNEQKQKSESCTM